MHHDKVLISIRRLRSMSSDMRSSFCATCLSACAGPRRWRWCTARCKSGISGPAYIQMRDHARRLEWQHECDKSEERRLYQLLRCRGAKYIANERLRYNASTVPNGRQPHLYIMEYEDNDCLGCYNVGRTGNFDKRVKDINAGHLKSTTYVRKYENNETFRATGARHIDTLHSTEPLQQRAVPDRPGAHRHSHSGNQGDTDHAHGRLSGSKNRH